VHGFSGSRIHHHHRSVDTLGDWVADAEMSPPALASFEPTSFLLTGNSATRSA
jgi:hypothetical protein